MKVLHVIPSLGPARGGPSFALPVLARGLAACGVEVHVATTDDNGPDRLSVPLEQPQCVGGVTTWYFPRQTHFYTFSWPLSRWIARHPADYDIIHIHALFSYAALAASWVAARSDVPYIVRPLGTLNRWGMARRRPLLKGVSFRLVERRILRGAAAIHYTSEQEREEAEELGVYAPAHVIPLGIDLRQFERPVSAHRFLSTHPTLANRTVILFLSRLDPKKGLDLLVPAFAQVHQACPETVLVIAGGGSGNFAEGLQDAVHNLGLDGAVIFAGFLEGEDKLSALAAASAFVLPSYSENFGIAAVEAMAAGVPVVLTEQVAVSAEVRKHEAGLVVAPDIGALAGALQQVVSDRGLSSRLAENAKTLAYSRFTASAAAREVAALYGRILEQRMGQPHA